MAKKPGRSRVLEEVRGLFELARSASQEKANLLVRKARKLAMHSRARIPRELRMRFCRSCGSYFRAENVRIRARKGMLVVYCLKCKRFMRLVYKRKAPAKGKRSNRNLR